MKCYREVWEAARNTLAEGGIVDASTDAWILFESVFHMSRSQYYLRTGEMANEDQIHRLWKLVERRLARIPVQQLTGEQEFMGLPFVVNEQVLIPRQDTEILAEQALELLIQYQQPQVLDLCTGSGCLAVSLGRLGNSVQVTASDLSEEALKIARINARKNQVEVRFLHSDLFQEIQGQFDLIVSNPPYIPTEVIETLEPEVRDHEPRMALDGDQDGLRFYSLIASQAGDYLKPGGTLALEIGYDQGEAVTSLLEDNGFTQVRVVQDLAGLDRVVIGCHLLDD